MKQPQILAFSAALLSTALLAHSQTVHDGAGKWPLTASMVHSGLDATHVNIYQNYVVHTGQLSLVDLSNVIVTKCDIGGFTSGYGITLINVDNVSISGNTFHDLGGGIGAVFTHVINSHFDRNTFNNVGECIHLDFGDDAFSHDDSVSYNVMYNNTRYAIEIQGNSSGGLKVMHNYCGGVSVATQSSAVDAKGVGVQNPLNGFPKSLDKGNEIAFNAILGNLNKPGNNQGGLEIYGSGANVHDNYLAGWGGGVYWDWTGWVPNTPWYVTNNIFVGCGSAVDAGSEGFGPTTGPYPDIKPTLNGNQIFAANDPKAPPVPTVAATVGGSTTQPTTKASADQPAEPPFAAVSQADGVHVSNLPGAAGTLTWTADGNSGTPLANPTVDQTGSVLVPAGATTAVITSIPNNWEAVLTFSGLPGTSVTVRANAAQQFPAVSPPAVSQPAVSQSNPSNPSNPATSTTQPAAVLIGHSRDGVTWTVDATVQP